MADVVRAASPAGAGGGEALYLGFDSSTQSCKVTAVRASDLSVMYSGSVSFAADLPQFEPVLHVDGARVTQDPLMWLAALDLLLARMQAAAFPFGDVAAVSGSGQQHGSVYLGRGADAVLASLDPAVPVAEQVARANEKGAFFAVPFAPIWMDSSTRAQCDHLEAAMPDGPLQVAQISGSIATERFTGNQIRKVFEDHPDAYAATERVALVSSFLCCVFAGGYAPIDASDGAGMNLLDVTALDWSPLLLDATAPGLREKLGPVVLSSAAVPGGVSRYFRERYGFSASCQCVVWSGDNPCSLVGLGVTGTGNTAVSLGTSDTLFGISPNFAPRRTGNVLTNPTDNSQKMLLLCFKNGSLTRQRVQEKYAGGSWDTFAQLVAATSPGNGGVFGFHLDFAEITPPIAATGEHYFDAATSEPLPATGPPASGSEGSSGGGDAAAAAASAPSAAQRVRSVLESQFLSMRLHAGKSGLTDVRRLVVTGGASANAAILQMIADVFGVAVEAIAQKDSASIGAAYRAFLSHRPDDARALMASRIKYEVVARPDAEAHAVYQSLLPKFEACQQRLLTAAEGAEAGGDGGGD